MKYNTRYTSLQCWHIHNLFPPDIAEQVISGERDLDDDEVILRDQALAYADAEESIVKLEQDFGGIYNGNNPSHGVYVSDDLILLGRYATAISHHWSYETALKHAQAESRLRQTPCVVVEYI